MVAALVLAMAGGGGAEDVTPARVVFETEGRGRVVVELAEREAPQTSAHFLRLVSAGAYTGMLWHRRVAGFVLQTGDPGSKAVLPEEARGRPGERGGTAGLGEGTLGPTVRFEPNGLRHARGTVGMALSSPGDDSGSSHFFINLADNFRLDGKYVVFGRVVEGMEVVERIRRGDLITSARLAGS